MGYEREIEILDRQLEGWAIEVLMQTIDGHEFREQVTFWIDVHFPDLRPIDKKALLSMMVNRYM